ncbi:hypothetical protein [Nitrosovibrio sp. Nv6]|uniref:hypothetical protein n=1 Tax=Nitrosovibrio sp. Nv6 TaxID=1855340 RepID=UPI0008B32AB0|nr:hypothetical protein [Nitrosovibrio sp. Nv6]SEO64602.1 hypothetical protein SAMN05216316_0699 [Nitrosovibrio sp. Nv6]
MAWPTVAIDTTSMDAGTDSPATARVQIKQMADNVNSIKDAKGVASGIAELDAENKVPTGQLPTIPASQGGTGQTGYAIGDLLYASASSILSKLPSGTSGYVLKSGGPGAAPSWADPGAFPTGTRMLFQQTSAPTGWTKETNAAYNDIALRVVTGTVGAGGATLFSNTFSGSKSTDALTLTTGQMPSHGHTYNVLATSGAGPNDSGGGGGSVTGTPPTNSTGGGGSHSHTISNFNLKYSDVIIASKN